MQKFIKNKNLFVIYFIAFLNSLTASVVIPILYVYAENFSMGDFAIAILFAAFPFAQFFVGPFIGALSDKYGRKPLLLISLLGTSLSNVLAALAGTGFILIIARLLDGATGGNISVAKAVISDQVDQKDRAKSFGLFGAMFGLGFLIGPIISLAVQGISLSAVYWVSALLALITTILTAIMLKETHFEEEVEENLFLNKTNYFTDTLKAVFRKDIGIFIFTEFAVALGFFMIVYAYQPYVLNVLGGTERNITIILILVGITSFLVQGFISRIFYPKFGLFKTMLFSIAGQIFLYFTFGFITDITIYSIAVMVWAFFNSLYRPILSSIISTVSAKNVVGKNLGYNEAYFGLGQFLGPLAGGAILTVTGSYSSPYFLGGIVVLITFVFIIKNKNKFKVD